MLKTQSEIDCQLFCVHIYNKLNSVYIQYIYSTRTPLDYYLLLIVL